MDFVKDRQYYVDQYDVLTIEDCLQWIEIARKSGRNVREIQKMDKIGYVGALAEIALYFKKGENYKQKESTIKKWMDRDKLAQEKYDNAQPPDNIFCDQCNFAMGFEGKDLHSSWDEYLQMLLFFECPNCHKRKVVCENGEIYDTRIKCPKCTLLMESTQTRKGELLTTTEICKSCGYKNIDVWDFEEDAKKSKLEEARRKYLLDNFRKEFCLTPEEGQQYIRDRITADHYAKVVDEKTKKDTDPRYQKARALKKIKVFEMEKLLKEVLEKEKYIELTFDRPEITKDVVIPFSVQESDSTRNDYDSQNDLKKLIKKTLEDTNWRLMSDGISQRLGILTGRVRGYENEDDIIKIV